MIMDAVRKYHYIFFLWIILNIVVFQGTISRLPVVYKGIINMYYVRVYICIYVCIGYGLSVHLRSLVNLRVL